MQLNQTILEASDGLQIQGHLAVTSRYEWNAIRDEHWGNPDDELVDRLLVKKRGDELAAAINQISWCSASQKTLHKGTRQALPPSRVQAAFPKVTSPAVLRLGNAGTES